MPRPKYFTLNKVSFHNTMPWRPVGVIRVLQTFIKLHNYFSVDGLLRPIIGCAGNDISHWFELKTTFVSEKII
uniref:Uncharacterized protein n=1 Tax=Oncorhynchus tshawytscha TaxID=74940 RepID=A0A8C8IJ87_ONCTS